MPTDPDDWPALVTYRMAYGLAARLAEARGYDMIDGRPVGSRAAGGDAATIVAEVLRRLGDDGPDVEAIVREATDDALAGRQPKW